MGIATAFALCLAALSLNPVEDVTYNRVDLVEVNHYYDQQGRRVFDQILFYDWCPAHGRYQVRAWRLLKCPAQIPHRSRQHGDFITIWHDGEVLREVRAELRRESWTHYDPELEERRFLPKERRRELPKR